MIKEWSDLKTLLPAWRPTRDQSEKAVVSMCMGVVLIVLIVVIRGCFSQLSESDRRWELRKTAQKQALAQACPGSEWYEDCRKRFHDTWVWEAPQ